MNAQFNLTHKRLTDGTLRLEQLGTAGEKDIIDMHPEQLHTIARQLAGNRGAGELGDLKRKIGVLSDKLEAIVCDKEFRVSLIQDDDGFAYLAKLDGLLDLALEFDGGRLIAESARCEAESNEASQGIGKTEKTPPEAIAGDSGQLALV